MPDSGYFFFNDIPLKIAPEQISVEKYPAFWAWSALRTESSVKKRSGFSELSVSLSNIHFTDTIDPLTGRSGYDDLMLMIAQIRLTPFVWIDNDFLRTTVLGDADNIALVFAIKHMTIVKDLSSSNVISVSIEMDWFNYFPYLKEYKFREDLLSSRPVNHPGESKIWRRLYLAEIDRHHYIPLKNINYLDTKIEFSEFATTTIKEYNRLNEEYNAIIALEKSVDKISEDTNLGEFVVAELTVSLSSEERAKTLSEELLPGTSFALNTNRAEIVHKLKNLSSNQRFKSIQDASEWGIFIAKSGKPYRLPEDPLMLKNEEPLSYAGNDTILIARQRTLNLNQSNLIVQNIIVDIDYTNRLAIIPMTGYTYPTMQHLGGPDISASMSIVTTSDNALQELHNFYASFEEQALNFRSLPAGKRTLLVDDSILNLCGIRNFINGKLQSTTVPGAPGTYQIQLELIDSYLTEKNTESFSQANFFVTNDSIRTKINEILDKNIKFVFPNSVSKYFNPFTFNGSTNLDHKFFYEYTGSKDPSSSIFQSLCEEYKTELNKFTLTSLKKLSSRMNEDLKADQTLEINTMATFFSLTNKEVPSIEKVQKDLEQHISQNKKWQTTIQKAKDPKYTKVLSTNDDGRFTVLGYGIGWQGLDQEILKDWNTFSINFLDTIKRKYIHLPEFKEARDLILQQHQIAQISECYPDFPFKELISLMERGNDQEKAIVEALKQQASKYILRGFNLTSILGPDCYLWNPQIDSLQDIVDYSVINKAINAVSIAQSDKMNKAEEGWFGGIYRQSIIGEQRYAAMEGVRLNTALGNKPQTPVIPTGTKSVMPSLLEDAIPSILDDAKGNNFDKKEGILLPAIIPGRDQDKFVSTNKFVPNAMRMQPADNSKMIRHNLGLHALEFGNTADNEVEPIDPTETIIANPPAVLQTPGTTPQFKWPTPPDIRRITSKFNLAGRPHPVLTNADGSPLVRPHKGIDIGSSNGQGSLGTPVSAIAPGKIIFVPFSETEGFPGKPHGGEGCMIKVDHGNGWVSKYFHLQWDEHLEELSGFFWRKNIPPDPSKVSVLNPSGLNLYINESQRNMRLSINTEMERRERRILGHIGNTGIGSAAHLHLELWHNGQPVDPEIHLDQNFSPSQGPSEPYGIDPANESLLTKCVDQFTKEMTLNQGYGMIRAFPTFKLYFIESDLGERKIFQFDDFYSYSSINSIEFISSRKIAADLLILNLNNISGLLSNKSLREIDPQSAAYAGINSKGKPATESQKIKDRGTARENDIRSLMLQPGMQLQLKLGYSNNPDDLTTLFNGVIVSTEQSEGDEETLTLVCQSFAIELQQQQHGDIKNWGGWLSSTGRTSWILEELLAYPEVEHFGRWEPGSPDTAQSDQIRSILKTSWRRNPSPQDDNIFAPPSKADSPLAILASTPPYKLFQQDLWDVIQEMTLRHPGYIAQAMPYQSYYGPRMTLFFGVPSQLYFARDATDAEKLGMENLNDIVKQNLSSDDQRITSQNEAFDPHKEVQNVQAVYSASHREISVKERETWLKKLTAQYAKDTGIVRSFRNYHLLTTQHHIIKNSITNSLYNTFNRCTVQYEDDSANVDKETGKLTFDDMSTLTLDVEPGIPDDSVREVIGSYENCNGSEMAKMYAISLLWRSMQEGYTGEIVTLGNPNIKPHDVCWLFDPLNDTFGPIGVEQVVHAFSPRTGFISVITPDMVVHVNEAASMAVQDAMGLVAEHYLRKIGLPEGLGNALVGASNLTAGTTGLPAALAAAGATYSLTKSVMLSPLALGFWAANTVLDMTGTFIWNKLATRSQCGHLFRYSPVVKHGKALTGGIPLDANDIGFIQKLGNWFKRLDDSHLVFEEVAYTINPANWFEGSQGNFMAHLLNTAKR